MINHVVLFKKYPFIDNQEVLNNLSDKMIDKAAVSLLIQLDESELSEILSPLDLSTQEIKLIVNDFK